MCLYTYMQMYTYKYPHIWKKIVQQSDKKKCLKMIYERIGSHTVTHNSTLQHTATHCNTPQLTATHFDTLQYTATHCYTLQHPARECTRKIALN